MALEVSIYKPKCAPCSLDFVLAVPICIFSVLYKVYELKWRLNVLEPERFVSVLQLGSLRDYDGKGNGNVTEQKN